MFRVNLTDLDRAGSKDFKGTIPVESPLWNGADLELQAPVEVDLRLTATPGGQVLARGEAVASVQTECRRCLKSEEQDLSIDLTMVWIVPDELGDAEDGEVRVLDPSSNELDLSEAIREEVLLQAPRFVLCDQECRGLCPQCGVNRNEQDCDCTLEEPDPRWEALRALQNE